MSILTFNKSEPSLSSMKATSPSEHELTGEVQSIRDFDGWCIVNILIPTVPNRSQAVVTGEFDIQAGELQRGLSYRFFGTWKTHPTYGPQFAVESYVTAQEQRNLQGISAYIERIGGLTQANVRSIIKEFGPESLTMIRTNPKEVACICSRISQEAIFHAAMKINRAGEMEPTRIALFELFCGRGIPKGAIEDCIDTWGKESPTVIRKDPFRMLVSEISGIGFKRADSLYLDLGYPKHRLKRQMLAIWHDMVMDMSGHTWHREDIAEKAALKAAGPDTQFEKAIRLGVRSKWLTERYVENENRSTSRWITEREKSVSEQKIAKHVKRIAAYRSILPQDGYDTMSLSRHQLDTLMPLLRSGLFILAGTPGTGKTFTAAQVLSRAITTLHTSEIAVVAPTGKAAVRITEAMERYGLPLKATTIHACLGVRGQKDGRWIFEFSETNPLPARLILVDEMSMTDTTLFASLLGAVDRGANVILVGDPYQLPPVGHGAPLRDLIASGIPCGLLTEIQRNSGAIVRACAAIKNGDIPTLHERGDVKNGLNLILIECDQNPDNRLAWISRILNKVRTNGIDGTPMDPIWDAQVLCATNRTRVEFNRSLQDGLNPIREGTVQENPAFRIGDKIICLKNTRAALRKYDDTDGYDDPTIFARWRSNEGLQTYLANGDLGRVLAVKKNAAVVKFVTPDRIVQITTQKPKKGGENGEEEKTGDFALAYAITGHKSQGSEWPITIINLENSPYVTNREWIYTAISRGKMLVICIGSRQDIARMTMKTGLQDRKTFLRELITGDIQDQS